MHHAVTLSGRESMSHRSDRIIIILLLHSLHLVYAPSVQNSSDSRCSREELAVRRLLLGLTFLDLLLRLDQLLLDSFIIGL